MYCIIYELVARAREWVTARARPLGLKGRVMKVRYVRMLITRVDENIILQMIMTAENNLGFYGP
jgi:hypothetical protein